ncbi:MAG: hypothetical protein U1F06_08350 [Steroidobacteraceae bacterium]
MDIGVEISLYPLTAEFIPPIEDFIRRLNREGGLKILTNSMSTQVFGPYDVVMGRVVRELRGTFETSAKAVFVMKVLGPLSEP